MHKCLKVKPIGYRACRKCRFPKGGQPKKVIKITINNVDHFIGTKHKLYNLRYSLISRCYNAKTSEFGTYQGKGIKVCEEWLNDPITFYTWCLKAGWKPNLSIDRIDSNGNYSPENCRFITLSENGAKAHKDTPKFGDNASASKLNSLQVKEIKQLIKEGKKNKEIACLFGVDRTTISCIRMEKTWKHI